VNNGARTIKPNFWTCVDDPKRFCKSIWFDAAITKIVPHSFAEKRIFDNEKWVDLKTVVGECPNVMYFHRNEKFMANRWLYEDTINWGNSKDNGGGRSVMLASMKILFLLGFRNVFLMGADFMMTDKLTYHFDEQRNEGAVRGNMSTYEKLKTEYFPQLKPHFEQEGFNVYNCNKESQLKVFDYVPFEDAIAFATANLGDVDNERTWGMYSKPEERQKWINEPPAKQKVHLKNIAARPQSPVTMDKSTIQINTEPTTEPMVEEVAKAIETPEVINPKLPTAMPMQSQKMVPPKPIPPPARLIKESKDVPEKQVAQQNKPQVKFVNFDKEQTQSKTQESDPTRIIRRMPCGGGISFGSSTTENTTLEDDGK